MRCGAWLVLGQQPRGRGGHGGDTVRINRNNRRHASDGGHQLCKQQHHDSSAECGLCGYGSTGRRSDIVQGGQRSGDLAAEQFGCWQSYPLRDELYARERRHGDDHHDGDQQQLRPQYGQQYGDNNTVDVFADGHGGGNYGPRHRTAKPAGDLGEHLY